MTTPDSITYDKYERQLRMFLSNKGDIQISWRGQYAFTFNKEREDYKYFGDINDIMKKGDAYAFQIKRDYDGKDEKIQKDGGGVLYIRFTPEQLGWLQKVLPPYLSMKLRRLMREVVESKDNSEGESKFQLRM